MDLQSLYRTMVRRKIVVIPVIVLVAAGLFYTYKSAPPVYKASGSIALANPDITVSQPEDGKPVEAPKGSNNPFLRYNDLTVVEDMVVRLVTSPSIDAQLRQNGVVGSYTIGSADIMYRGPIIDVTSEAPSADAAKTSARLVMEEIGTQLEVLQNARGTDKPYQIYTLPVVEPESASAVFSGTLRRLMLAGVLGVVAIFASGLLADRVAGWWSRRRRKGTDAAGASTVDAPDGVVVATAAAPSAEVGSSTTGAPAGDLATDDDAARMEPSAPEARYQRQREARRGTLARPQRRSRSARS